MGIFKRQKRESSDDHRNIVCSSRVVSLEKENDFVSDGISSDSEVLTSDRNENDYKKSDSFTYGVKRNLNESTYNILHLSDFHFGIENWEKIKNPRDLKQKRKFQLNKLIDKIAEINDSSKIHFIVVSGDIAWNGEQNEYYEFIDWIKKLCNRIGFRGQNIIVCAGNHDFNRNVAIDKITNENYQDALAIDNVSKRVMPFEQFCEACKGIKMKSLTNDEQSAQYLYGVSHFRQEGLVFAVLNSAWNESDNTNSNNRWFGISLLYDVSNNIKEINRMRSRQNEAIVLTVFHHPLSEMNMSDSQETYRSEGDTSRSLLLDFSSIILNGHTHGKVKKPDQIDQSVLVFNAGSAQTNDTEMRGFEVITIQLSQVP